MHCEFFHTEKMKKYFFYILISILLHDLPAHAKVQSATVAVHLPAGQHKTIKLKNLPRNAALKVEIEGQGSYGISFINEDDSKKYPDVSRPLFQSKVHDKISFAVKIPESGNYYVVFDNVSGSKEINLNAAIQGASDSDEILLQKDGKSEGEEDEYSKTLDSIGEELNKLFIFEQFPITVMACGKAGAFSNQNGIMLCTEFIKKVHTTVGNGDKSNDVLLFSIFHEVAHVLLLQWGYPFYDNEDVADEFATVLILLMGQSERLSPVTEFFISNPTSSELITKALQGDRHQLSIQRARNIIAWTKDAERVKRWLIIFTPHMQTPVLVKLKEKPTAWIDPVLIEEELAKRKQ